jgi:hypothetical protein
MRVIFGIVLGGFLTVGGAFVADSMSSGRAGVERPMVNWDVVGKNLRELKVYLRDQWAKASAPKSE